MNPELAYAFVGMSANVRKQQALDHEAVLDPRLFTVNVLAF